MKRTLKVVFLLWLLTCAIAAVSQAQVPSGSLSVDKISGKPLNSDDRSAVVLIHGWTGKSQKDLPINKFGETEDLDWFRLVQAFHKRLVGTSTRLLLFHWEKDASTGPAIDFAPGEDGFTNATEAANNAFLNGGSLAIAINGLAPDLRRITFVAHSAGAWVAYRAVANLLKANPYLVVNLVLLDPFIPAGVGSSSVVIDLTTSRMGGLGSVQGKERIYRLENYFSVDLTDLDPNLGDGGGKNATSQVFLWEGNRHLNLRVDYFSLLGGQIYGGPVIDLHGVGHSGPKRFYADTITAATRGSTVPGNLKSGPWEDYTTVGFFLGLVYGETLLPRITEQPAAPTRAAPVGTRVVLPVSIDGADSFQWFNKNGEPHGESTSIATLTFPAVSISDAGAYVLRATNIHGHTFSDKVVLEVTSTSDETNVKWVARPPRVVTSGDRLAISWQIQKASTRSHVDVHWATTDPTTVFGCPSPLRCSTTSPLGTLSGGGATITAPTVSASTTLRYVVHFQAVAGGVHYYSPVAAVRIDPTGGPVVTNAIPTADSTWSTTVSPLQIGGTVAGGSGTALVRWSTSTGTSGVAAGTMNWSASIPLTQGSNVITVTATDSVGRTGSDVLTVTLSAGDTSPPSVTVTSPTSSPAHVASSGLLNLAGTASDSGTGVSQVRWSTSRGATGAANGTTSWSAIGVPIAPGTTVISVTAIDGSGNSADDTLTVSYSAPDTSPPILSQNAPVFGGGTTSTVRASLRFDGGASDDVGVAYVKWINRAGGSGTAAGTANWYADVPLTGGLNIVDVQAFDAAGRRSNIVSSSIHATSPIPTLQITGPTANTTWGTTGNSISLQGSASAPLGLASLTWTNNRGGSGPTAPGASWTIPSIPLQTGENILTVTASDPEGHTKTVSLTVSYVPPQAANITWIPKSNLPGATNAPRAFGVIGTKIYISGASGSTSMNVYDTATDVWNGSGALANGPAILNGAASIGGKLYAVGFLGDQATWTLWVYDPSNDSWVGEASSVPQRQWPGVAAVGGKLLVIGGRLAGGRVDEYDPLTHSWRSRAPMPTPRDRMGVAVLDNKVYTVAGATDGGLPSDVTEVYNPSTDTWSTLPAQMIPSTRPDRRVEPGAAALGGRMYVIGGHDGELNPVGNSEEYIQAIGWWRVTRAPSQTHFRPAVAPVNGKLYVIGSAIYNGQGVAASVEEGTMTADNVPPAVTINQPTTDGTWATNSPSVALGGRAWDNVAVGDLRWANARGGGGIISRAGRKDEFGWTTDAITLQLGDNQITVTALDADGNSTVASLIANYSLPVAPRVTSLTLNGGLQDTPSRTVILNNTTVGLPAEFQASEQTDFAGALWQPYSNAPKFLLSASNGRKSVYIRVRNAAGESATISDTIFLRQTASGVGSFTSGATVACSAGEYHRLAVDSDGTVYVLCWYGALGASGYQLALHRSTDGGASFGPALPIPGSQNVTNGLDLFIDRSNVVHVVWSDNDAQSETYYARSLNGGDTFSSPVRLRTGNSWGGYEARRGWGGMLHVVADGRGRVHVAFPANTYTSGGSLIGPAPWMSSSTNGGASFAPEFPVYQPTADSGFELKRLRIFGGEFHVLYSRSINGHPTAYFVRGTAGDLVNLPVKISPTTSDYTAQDFAIAAGGSTIYAIVRDASSDGALYAITSRDSGASWGPRLRLDDANSLIDFGRLQIDRRGALHYVVRDTTFARLRYTYSADGATTFSLPVTAIAPARVKGIDSAVDDPRSRLYVSTDVGSGQIAIAYGSVAPDSTGPTVTVHFPTSLGILTVGTQTITLSGVATDFEGATQVKWANSRGGSGVATGASAWTAPGVVLQPGTNVVTITGTDPTGNFGAAKLTITYAPETVAPTVAITSPTTNDAYQTTASNVVLRGTASDNVAVSEVQWTSQFGPSGTATGAASWTTLPLPLQPGPNLLTVTAFDIAGNSQTDSITVTYKPTDTTPPVIAIISPTSAVSSVATTPSVDIAGFAGDDIDVTQVTCSSDRTGACTPVGTAAWTVAGLKLLPGANAISITAKDAAGNTATATIDIVAMAAPTITTQPLDRAITVGQTVSFTVVATGHPAPIYQWQVLTTGRGSWTNLTDIAPYSGTATASLTVTSGPKSLTGYQYRALVTNDMGSATSSTATLTVTLPTMSIDKTSLVFSAVNTGVAFTAKTGTQSVHLTQTGTGTVTWTAASTTPWLLVSPTSGTGSSTLNVSTQFQSGLVATQTGSITLTITGASNTAGPITVTLNTVTSTAAAVPFGSFDTPTDGSTGVAGSIAVTGWAMDDVEITRVKIMRDSVAGELAGTLVFIGDAVFVDGARPDIQASFPMLPRASRAGWGYLMLTNFLPALGNGTFKLYAIAEDADGHSTTLGSKTITCTNSTATAPFGAIDTPGQGETISGNYNNFGWVLSPGTRRSDVPSGGQVRVVIDGTLGVTPVGWVSRADLTALFPAAQFSGVGSALAVATLNTTTLTNGVHTISWLVTDNQGSASGIGSRYFTVSNGSLYLDPAQGGVTTRGGSSVITGPAMLSMPMAAGLRMDSVASLAQDVDAAPRMIVPIGGRRGYNVETPLQAYIFHGGLATIQSEELDRIELHLEGIEGQRHGVEGALTGYLRVPGGLAALPIGSSLNASTGEFTWQPGVAFLGTYDLVFVRWSGGHAAARQDVRIVLNPKGSNRVGPQVVIDTPAASGSSLWRPDAAQPFVVAGWAADLDSTIDRGVDTVHVWAYPLLEGGEPIFIGAAEYDGARPDVAAVYGERFEKTGYGIRVEGLVPGNYDIAVFAYSTVTGGFMPAKTVRLTVR